MAQIEIINTGTELMVGSVLNSHQSWLCQHLSLAGYSVSRQVAVHDEGPVIQQVVRESMGRADVIITTGGLGPTSDDLTREYIASLFNTPLKFDAEVAAGIEGYFQARGKPAPPNALVQAQVPQGAIVLENKHGTAPGLVLFAPEAQTGSRRVMLIMLPGPPRELHPMFLNGALPLIQKHYPLSDPYISEVYLTTGLGESYIQKKIQEPLAALVERGLQIGYCAKIGEVELRLSGHGTNGRKLIEEAGPIVQSRLGHHIYSKGRVFLEETIVRLLSQRGETVAVAESCTGGFLSNRITNVPGASEVFLGGFITYSNSLKENLLGVNPATLAEHGAVSQQTAREMAEGTLSRTGATYALSITGIAGPGGGTAEKPVGLVFIGLACKQGTSVSAHNNQYDRPTFKFLTSQQALEILRQKILKT